MTSPYAPAIDAPGLYPYAETLPLCHCDACRRERAYVIVTPPKPRAKR